MDSLVANYSSDSDSDDSASISSVDGKELEKKPVNFLNLAFDDPTSDNDADREQETDDYKKAIEYLTNKKIPVKLPNLLTEALPAPSLEKKVQCTITKKMEGSVFSNQFQNAEDAKLSILEKHVKTTTIEKKNEIGGKKVCWNYRKGKCRKGHRCQFAHDNDILTNSSGVGDDEQSKVGLNTSKSYTFGESYYSGQNMAQTSKSDLQDEDSYMSNKKRKKRYGTGDGLIPPKKAFNVLLEERADQRPWTVSKKNS